MTLVTETKLARSCTGIHANSTVSEFLDELEDIFNSDVYMLLERKTREVGVWFEDRDMIEVMKAWTFHGSSHPLLNDSLNTMRGSGWTLEIADDGTHIFSRSRDSSGLEENSAARELIMDAGENMTLTQLAICQIGSSPQMIVIRITWMKLVNSTMIPIPLNWMGTVVRAEKRGRGKCH